MQTATLRETSKEIDEIVAYEHGALLYRYMKDFSATRESAARCFLALKQFLVVCSLVPGRKVPSEPVDDIWHTFLLYTRDYQSFCEKYLGRFIHHQPATEGASSELYLQTRSLAMQLFKQTDDEFWPLRAKATCDADSHSGCCDGVSE